MAEQSFWKPDQSFLDVIVRHWRTDRPTEAPVSPICSCGQEKGRWSQHLADELEKLCQRRHGSGNA